MQCRTTTNLVYSNASNMLNNEAILKAIDDLNSQETPNVTATAKKYNVVPSTLLHRFKGQTVSHTEARSRSAMLLSNAQEATFIIYLNKLSARGMHPTPQMLKNLVVEMVKCPIKKRWIERFCKRHGDVIQSVYLHSINHARYIADNSKHFQHYFNCVCVQFIAMRVYSLYIKFS